MVNSTTVAATLVAGIFNGMTADNDFRVKGGNIIKDCKGQRPEKKNHDPLARHTSTVQGKTEIMCCAQG
jgi:hypothetical protein